MAGCLNFAVRYIKGDVVRLGRRLLPSSVHRARSPKMRSDTGDLHSSQRGSGEALRRAEADARVSFFGPWGAIVPPLGRRKLASMFERLCCGFVAAKHRLELGGKLGNSRIALGVEAMGIYRKM